MMSDETDTTTPDEYPTTAIPHNGNPANPKDVPSGIPHGAAADPYQKRLVGNVREGQVLVDAAAVREQDYDSDQSHYDAYEGHVWDITDISEDSRRMTLTHRDSGEGRRLTVARFARETIEGERWMFLKDSYAANTWGRDMSSTRCENCGVNRDAGLSREDHFETEANGRPFRATLRRCVGCGNYGVLAMSDDGRMTGLTKFTTGVLEGPDAPWK